MNEMWEWYVAGPIIGVVFFLLRYAGENFGISSIFEDVCAISTNNKLFNWNWSDNGWRLIFAFGLVAGGTIGGSFLTSSAPMYPEYIFGLEGVTGTSLIYVLGGGLLIGFGTRYAGGCTSGHAITGLSSFQLPSLVAVFGFFTGGLVMVHFFMPYL